MLSLIEIDGSIHEGGGQILRTATALSAITKKPCRVFNIRKKRPKPGLMPQHLLGVQALAQLCCGRTEGDELGSEEIEFYPGQDHKKEILVKIPTAGSITLVLQALLMPSILAPSPVKIVFRGGATDTFFAPTIDYFCSVFLKILEKIGVKVEINIPKRGYYPEGGSEAEIIIYPCKLKKLNLTERGSFVKILGLSGAAESLKEKLAAERQLQGVREILGKLKLPAEEKINYYPTRCPGSQICLVAEFENTIIGTDSLGRLDKRAEDVGKEAGLELLKEQKNQACLDKHMADQIIPYLALAPGKSQVTVSEITPHCRTNIWVTERFLSGKFQIKDNLISWNPF